MISEHSNSAKDRQNLHLKSFGIALLLCFAAFAFGGLFQPGEWYEQLNRAPWSPPNIVFPIVWTVLYIMIAIAGWQCFRSGNRVFINLWCLQLFLNGLWSWIFFGQHWVLVGLVSLVLINAIVINLALKTWRGGLRSISLLLSPYIAWLLLATSLNAYVVFAN